MKTDYSINNPIDLLAYSYYLKLTLFVFELFVFPASFSNTMNKLHPQVMWNLKRVVTHIPPINFLS